MLSDPPAGSGPLAAPDEDAGVLSEVVTKAHGPGLYRPRCSVTVAPIWSVPVEWRRTDKRQLGDGHENAAEGRH